MPDTGLVTPTLKLKRPQLKKHYNDVIEKLYADIHANVCKTLTSFILYSCRLAFDRTSIAITLFRISH